jgi:hypothetical protein
LDVHSEHVYNPLVTFAITLATPAYTTITIAATTDADD